jgi:hypothetical protein
MGNHRAPTSALPEDKLNAGSFLLAGNELGGRGRKRYGKVAAGSATKRNTGTNTALCKSGIEVITIEGFEPARAAVAGTA